MIWGKCSFLNLGLYKDVSVLDFVMSCSVNARIDTRLRNLNILWLTVSFIGIDFRKWRSNIKLSRLFAFIFSIQGGNDEFRSPSPPWR